MADYDQDLPLFSGPHIPANRFQSALEHLDLRAAAADAPAEWQTTVLEMAAAVDDTSPARADLDRLRRCVAAAAIDKCFVSTFGRVVGPSGLYRLNLSGVKVDASSLEVMLCAASGTQACGVLGGSKSPSRSLRAAWRERAQPAGKPPVRLYDRAPQSAVPLVFRRGM